MQLEVLQRHTVRTRKISGRTDTEQDFVRVLIFVVQIVRVTSHDKWNSGLLGDFLEFNINVILDFPVRR